MRKDFGKSKRAADMKKSLWNKKTTSNDFVRWNRAAGSGSTKSYQGLLVQQLLHL